MTKSTSNSMAATPASLESNQYDERLAAWERSLQRQCAADEPVARAFEALHLSLAKESASGFTRDCDYMKQTQRHGLKDAWRVKICRWMFETGKAFELSVDTIGCAISCMDQFLCAESVDKVMMQLLSLVCVFVASKMHDPEPITLVELSLLCEARFSQQDICNVEMHLLRIVNWELNPPNTFTFARDVVHALALKNAGEVEHAVMELLKLVAEDYDSIFSKASSVALAAVQIIIGWQSGARCYAAQPSATEDFVAAFNLVQRVHAATFDQEDHQDNNADADVDVSCSPVAVDGFPLMVTVVEDFESLQLSLKTPSTPTSSTQRALFVSPVVTKQCASPAPCSSLKGSSKAISKKRQRAASMSLSH
ncbi:hypothetical protein PybrP1_001349 [[Pythium] brassicae (nom. inval.)]|nr:hypothetical protein PybrP1_001349 [[Pythium] brassicae (nom. inval.)]